MSWQRNSALDQKEAEDRAAEATARIRRAVVQAGYAPSGIAESGNGPAMFTFVVEILGHDYVVEVAANSGVED